MRFVYDKPQFGDMIRARAGSIYHYGIYVSDDEVIQFGPSPKDPNYLKKEKLILKSDLKTFCLAEKVQVGRPNKKEKEKLIPKDLAVAKARSRIGEGNYNLIHNNCEHFVYDCLLGYKYCSKEAWARNNYNKRNILNVYLMKINDIEIEDVYPKERDEEIKKTKLISKQKEKYAAWKLLEYGFKHSFNKELQDLKFTKNDDGKWTCKKYYFSISHSKDIVMVAVANKPVGVDIEYRKELHEDKLKKRICLKNEENNDFYELWTKKESIYKCYLSGPFKPLEIDTDKYECLSGNLENYVYSVTGKLKNCRVYLLEDDKLKRL